MHFWTLFAGLQFIWVAGLGKDSAPKGPRLEQPMPGIFKDAAEEIEVAESQPWSVAEWAVAPRFDSPRATVPVLVLG